MAGTVMPEPTRGVVRHLGGESGHRSFFGGTHSAGRVTALGFCLIVGLVCTPLFGWPALLAAAVGVGVVLLVTARDASGFDAGAAHPPVAVAGAAADRGGPVPAVRGRGVGPARSRRRPEGLPKEGACGRGGGAVVDAGDA